MEEAKKKELYTKMLEIAEKYKDVEIKDWQDEYKLLLLSIMDKLSEWQPRTIQTIVDDGTWANSEEGKKKLAELREKIFEKEFKLDCDNLTNLLELEPGAFDDIYFPSIAEKANKESR